MGGAGIKRGKCPRLRRKGAGSVENFWVAEEKRGASGRRCAGSWGSGPAHCSGRITLAAGGLPRAAERRRQLPTGCRTVLLPGGAGAALRAGPAAAVSYGTGPRDTLTLSSREGRQLWCAIQRELVTVEGRVVERQELPLRLPDHMSPPVCAGGGGGPAAAGGCPRRSWAGTAGAVRGGQG